MTSSVTSPLRVVKSKIIAKRYPVNKTKADLNILLLGETGVGKTTFINAFVNYLTYNSLKEAMKGDMVVIIPAAFTITDPETYESQVIKIGTPDTNENNVEDGQSKTQGCKSYIFSIGNRNLRLIDTPGIGDTRGVDQDAKNFEHILAYISQYKHLDGICILLKPNEKRENIIFRFCIKGLLTHLHRSARNNIMFIFTCGGANFDTPGDTVPRLKKFLKDLEEKTNIDVSFTKDNTFTFDNESFLFLAKYKNGVPFNSAKIDVVSQFWDETVKEYENLLGRIVRCMPHIVRDTLSLNEAKQLIRKLHRPTAEIIRLIQENLQLAEEYKVETKKSATISPSLTKISYSNDHISVPQYSGMQIKLPYPRTVCTSESCIDFIVVKGVREVNYTSHCHDHCYLLGVEQEQINNPILKTCDAIDSEKGK